MSLRPPAHFGDQPGAPGGPISRRSAETLLSSLLGSGVFRQTHPVALYDQVFGETLEQAVEVSTPQLIASTTYAALTGTGLTVDVPVGGAVIVAVAGGCTFEGTPGAGDAWLTISDGTNTAPQQLTSIVAGDWCGLSVAWAVEITAQTTFELQSKLQGLSGNVTVLRSHLALTATPQSPRFLNEPSSYIVPLYVADVASRVFQRAILSRSTELPKHAQSFYRIDFGIQREGRFDVLTTFDGQTQSLLAGVPFDLTETDLEERLSEGDVVSARVYREGTPSSLLGTSAFAVTELVGI